MQTGITAGAGARAASDVPARPHPQPDPEAEADRNAATVRRFVEKVQNGGDPDAAASLIHPDFVDHSPAPGSTPGPESVLKNYLALRRGISDFHADVLMQLARGDYVTTHKLFTGRHTGELLGIEPTGKPVALSVIDIVRLRGGRLVEHWGVLDVTPLLANSPTAASRPEAST
jgi:predicted ester cyclase